MAFESYEQETMAGATGIELIVALYDAAIRFLYKAAQCVEEGDVHGRRLAVKKFIDVVMYLQARLRPDIGGSAAATLGDFYAAMFTMALEASHEASSERFKTVISCVSNVRDAWLVAARSPEAGRILPRELRTQDEKYLPSADRHTEPAANTLSARWSA